MTARSLPTPYYDDGKIQIYHGDCREIMSELSGVGVDLVLTDPPFFMPAQHYSSRKKWQRTWSDATVLASFWAEIVRGCVGAMKPSGNLLTFCNADSYAVFYPELYRSFSSLSCIVWDKGKIGMGSPWRHQHELIIAARWEQSFFVSDGRAYADVFTESVTPSAERDHPVEKPSSVLLRLLHPTTPEDGLVFDPFAGSGTTLEAAKQKGCRAIGIEMEERYCEIAARRLGQEVLPL